MWFSKTIRNRHIAVTSETKLIFNIHVRHDRTSGELKRRKCGGKIDKKVYTAEWGRSGYTGGGSAITDVFLEGPQARKRVGHYLFLSDGNGDVENLPVVGCLPDARPALPILNSH